MTDGEKVGARLAGKDAAFHRKPERVESFAFVDFDCLLNTGKPLWQLSGENQQLAAFCQHGRRIWRQGTGLLKLFKRSR